MRIRFNRTLQGDYGRAVRHEVKDVADTVGKSLVDRGLAVVVSDREAISRPAPAGLRPKAKAKVKAAAPPQQ